MSRSISRTVRETGERAPRFPADCPAFMLLDRGGFAFDDNEVGEVAEGTFNDQGGVLMLGFARGERWWNMLTEPGGDTALAWSPYFSVTSDRPWQGAWHYTGRLRPLTRAAREMLAVVGNGPFQLYL